MVEHVTQRFDALAPDYDRATRLLEGLLLRRLRRRLLKGATGRVLEVGVGTGRNLPHYADGVQLWGVDVSEQMLQRAQQRADRLGRAVYLNVMDAGALAFPAGAFDVVVSALTLCSMEDPRKTLCELHRVCKPDGALLFLEHGRGRIGWLNRWLDRIEARHWQEFGCHPNRDMERLIRDSGLALERVDSHLWGMVKLFWAKRR